MAGPERNLENAKRRLNRILADEDYGPKLARLGRRDQREVLELIEQNRGREARAAIVRLDERRRRGGERAEVRRNLETRLQVRMGSLPRANPTRIAERVAEMTDNELRQGLAVPLDELRRLARQPPRRYHGDPQREINPFWYH